MLGPIGSFFASLFSAEFYYWATHVRRGVGLSYIFGIAVIAVIIGTLYCTYYYGANWLTFIVTENRILPLNIRVFFSVIIPNELLVLLVLPVLACIILTLLIFNLAIICSATIGQAFNYLYDEPLEFIQVLRANCYIVVAALALSGLFLLFFPTLIGLLPAILLIVIIIYNFYGIVYPKFDL